MRRGVRKRWKQAFGRTHPSRWFLNLTRLGMMSSTSSTFSLIPPLPPTHVLSSKFCSCPLHNQKTNHETRKRPPDEGDALARPSFQNLKTRDRNPRPQGQDIARDLVTV